jgi:5-methylcytosine-specific restriction endonuclease McrA
MGFAIDHVTPRIEGGGNHPDNLQTLCHPCNGIKGNRDNAWLAKRLAQLAEARAR